MAKTNLTNFLDRLIVQRQEIGQGMRGISPKTSLYQKLERQLVDINLQIEREKAKR